MPISLQTAKALTTNDVLLHDHLQNADGTPMRFRVNGAVKTWKRDPQRIRIPVKRGLYEYGELTNRTNEGGSFTLDISQVTLEVLL